MPTFKGYRTLVWNFLFVLIEISIIAFPQLQSLFGSDPTPRIIVLGMGNIGLRAITTTAIGEPE